MINGFEFSLKWTAVLALVAAVIALCNAISPRLRYHLKFLLASIASCTIMCFILPISLLRPRDIRNALMYVPFLNRMSALVGITWEIQGEEHLAKDSACIVVCNHQSFLDFFGLMALWPTMKKCAVVGKKELIYIAPPVVIAGWLAESIFIDRSKSKESQALLSESVQALKNKKAKIWIFPEGTRTKNPGRTLGQFKKGAFHIAIQNKLPIVPVVFPPYTFIDDEKMIFNSGKMIAQVLPPIDTSKCGPEDVNKLTELTQTIMTAEFQRLCPPGHEVPINSGCPRK